MACVGTLILLEGLDFSRFATRPGSEVSSLGGDTLNPEEPLFSSASTVEESSLIGQRIYSCLRGLLHLPRGIRIELVMAIVHYCLLSDFGV